MGRKSRAKCKPRRQLVSAALPHQYGDRGHSLWEITFPSGTRFALSGDLWVGRGPDGVIGPAVVEPETPGARGRVLVLDPRALVLDAQGRVAYGHRPAPGGGVLLWQAFGEGSFTAATPAGVRDLLVELHCHCCGLPVLSGRPAWETAIETARSGGWPVVVVCRGCGRREAERAGLDMVQLPSDPWLDCQLRAALAEAGDRS
jgi:hypothetical protein